MIEAQHLSSPPPFDFRNVREGDLVAIFHIDYEDPWKGSVRDISRRSIEIQPYAPTPTDMREMEKRFIKKIYRLDINSGKLKELIYLSPDHMLRGHV